MRLVTAILVLAAAFCLTGCIHLREQSIDHGFSGLRSTMDRTHTTSMLLVHGMGGYSYYDPDTLIGKIQSELQLQQVGTVQRSTMPPDVNGNKANIRRLNFVNPAGHELRIYVLYWESLTTPLKKQYLAFDDEPPEKKLRLPIHNDMKQSLMNSTIPDVILYVGEYKPVIQKSVKIALQRMRADLGNESDYEYFFVTFSLGSKIVFDVIDEMDDEADPADSNAIVDRTASFFMLANPLPLLGLGSVSPTTKPAGQVAGPGYESILRFVRRKHQHRETQPVGAPTTGPSNEGLAVVAVSDPNDLFSYAIPPYVHNEFPMTFINVRMSVATTGYWVPTEGFVVNPMQAHTGYGHDPDVIKLIIDGGKATK